MTVLSVLFGKTKPFNESDLALGRESWRLTIKKRKAGAPSEAVTYLLFSLLCQHMLLCWKVPIMLKIMPA